MKVPYNYLPYEFKNPNKIISDWKALIKTTDFTLGQFVEKFERRFSRFVGQNIVFPQIMELMH